MRESWIKKKGRLGRAARWAARKREERREEREGAGLGPVPVFPDFSLLPSFLLTEFGKRRKEKQNKTLGFMCLFLKYLLFGKTK